MAVLAYLVYQSSPDPVLPIPTQTQVTQLPPATPPKKIVSNSAWDGSVSQVETYLRRYLKDPDSYQSIEWSPVSELPDGKGFIVRHMYRAKNSFGGYGIDNKIFLLDAQGNVLGAEDIKAK